MDTASGLLTCLVNIVEDGTPNGVPLFQANKKCGRKNFHSSELSCALHRKKVTLLLPLCSTFRPLIEQSESSTRPNLVNA